ncbi:PAP2-like protein [Plasmodium gonderi]|uniref:PAP2-like protein n=1 Tax=Plasmodium gonderi TaxID=77519 RepID=A0A1Y1J8Z9_PLAGO|nr:PAP2-like protein [Plasmodium gonderi]GAW78981.1 PAP2-like protein [Plasmodium gonderi]
MLNVCAPVLLSFGHLISTVRCINLASFLLFWGGGGANGINPSDVDSTTKKNNKSERGKKMEEYIDEKVKINLRSKKINNLKPTFINPETEIYYFLRSDGNYDELYAKYPLCETKYKIADKLKGLSLFQKTMIKNKKLALLKTCILEMYGVFFVTIRNTNDIMSVIATVYGYVPYLLCFLIFIGLILTFNKYLLCLSIIIPTQLGLNDLVLKQVLKMSRPINSALNSYGMPSGHSSFSFTILTFIFLHLLESKRDKWNIITFILALIALLPIPWSRVHIEDHTFYQAIFGCLLGLFLGSVSYLIKRHYYKEKSSK